MDCIRRYDSVTWIFVAIVRGLVILFVPSRLSIRGTILRATRPKLDAADIAEILSIQQGHEADLTPLPQVEAVEPEKQN